MTNTQALAMAAAAAAAPAPVRVGAHIAAERQTEVSIHAFTDGRAAQWDTYVLNHPCGSPFHLTAWKKSMEHVFRYKPMYLMALERGQVRGVLPLFLIENLLIKRALISSPFAVYGGALTDSDHISELFRDHVTDMGRQLQVQYIELRNGYEQQVLGFSPIQRYVTFTQDIGSNREQILQSIPRKTRYMVRKAVKEGFSVRTELSDFSRFADLYSRNLRRLGTPAFPRQHYEGLLSFFKGSIDVREVWLQGRVAAAVLTFYFRDRVLPYYGASDPAFNLYAPNNFMYYDLMCSSGENGYRTFDFGRSKVSSGGSYDFKAHWGMREKILPYEMHLVNRKELPNFTPRNPAFKVPMQCWQKLPLPITRVLGPQLIRLVP